MTAQQERPDPVPGLNRVRIIPPANSQWAAALAYSVEIDGTPVHFQSLDVRFEPNSLPLVTLSFPAVVENTELLALLSATAFKFDVVGVVDAPTEDDDGDEPPFPDCLEEC